MQPRMWPACCGKTSSCEGATGATGQTLLCHLHYILGFSQTSRTKLELFSNPINIAHQNKRKILSFAACFAPVAALLWQQHLPASSKPIKSSWQILQPTILHALLAWPTFASARLCLPQAEAAIAAICSSHQALSRHAQRGMRAVPDTHTHCCNCRLACPDGVVAHYLHISPAPGLGRMGALVALEPSSAQPLDNDGFAAAEEGLHRTQPPMVDGSP